MTYVTWEKSEIADLARVSERVDFLYVDRCTVNRDQSGIILRQEAGTVEFPASLVSTLLLGPGTSITHAAAGLLADSACSIAWVGERASSLQAFGRCLNGSTALLVRQAELVSDPMSRLEIARQMYVRRFGDPELESLSLQKLRGLEGRRVRTMYAQLAEEYGIAWTRRSYKAGDANASDPVNQALSYANSVLYALVGVCIHALGLSPGLGFVHTGGAQSFVHDMADLYKAELSLPAAFQAAARKPDDVLAQVRRSLREQDEDFKLLRRCTQDLQTMFGRGESESDVRVGFLWDGELGVIDAGRNYGEEEF